MSIKTRLDRLEARRKPYPSVGRVIVTQRQAATTQWLKEHPGQPLPELLIARVIVNTNQPRALTKDKSNQTTF